MPCSTYAQPKNCQACAGADNCELKTPLLHPALTSILSPDLGEQEIPISSCEKPLWKCPRDCCSFPPAFQGPSNEAPWPGGLCSPFLAPFSVYYKTNNPSLYNVNICDWATVADTCAYWDQNWRTGQQVGPILLGSSDMEAPYISLVLIFLVFSAVSWRKKAQKWSFALTWFGSALTFFGPSMSSDNTAIFL